MKLWRTGSVVVPEAIFVLAQGLLDVLPDPLQLLTGITLTDIKTGRRVTVDLIVVTGTAIFVGIDVAPERPDFPTPRATARLLAQVLEQERLLQQPMVVYAFWVGKEAPSIDKDGSPLLPDTAAMQQHILQVSSKGTSLPNKAIASLAEGLLRHDAASHKPKRSPVSHLRHALQDLAELPGRIDAGLQEQIRQPFIFRRSGFVLPADVNKYLEKALLAQEGMLEDADYSKITPNDFLVELNVDNYEQNYRPIERNVCKNWEEKLRGILETANSRWGRQTYKFGGPVRFRIHPVSDMKPGEVRIQHQITPEIDANEYRLMQPCLRMMSTGQQWQVPAGTVTIGRSGSCDIYLDMPIVQKNRLVSGQHAYIIKDHEAYRFFDGNLLGEPSTNGSFVNGRRVRPEGCTLSDGDVIILAALDAARPLPDTPGAVTFQFLLDCVSKV